MARIFRARFLWRDRSGNALVEFGLSAPLLFMLSAGVTMLGLRLDRYLTMRQTARAGANMYSTGINFGLEANKNLLLEGAGGLKMTSSGGNGVIYLSRIVKPETGPALVDQRFVIGDPSIRSSSVAMPTAGLDGTVEVPTAATLPASVVLNAGERAYLVEVYHKAMDLELAPYFAKDVMGCKAMF